MIRTPPLVLTGPRRALGEQLDRLERLGIPVTSPRVELDEQELRQLQRRLDALGVKRGQERQAK